MSVEGQVSIVWQLRKRLSALKNPRSERSTSREREAASTGVYRHHSYIFRENHNCTLTASSTENFAILRLIAFSSWSRPNLSALL